MMTEILIAVLILVVIVLLFLRMEARQFERDVCKLYDDSGTVPTKTFSYDQLENLPGPVQRYFKYALKEGQPFINTLRLKHKGYFKSSPDKGWMKITGEQYFTVANPGFIWKGSTTFFTAYDRFVNGRGGLIVKLFSLIKVVHGKGKAFDHGELQRWLAENFWFPTNLLPGDHLEWQPIDANSAMVMFNYNDTKLPMKATFNEQGQLVSVECDRSMEENRLEKWLGNTSEYQEHNGMMIPTLIEAVWLLKAGSYPYARFKLEAIEYEVGEPF